MFLDNGESEQLVELVHGEETSEKEVELDKALLSSSKL